MGSGTHVKCTTVPGAGVSERERYTMRREDPPPMAEMSPEDLEKLRRLEEEVDREREDAKKKREELEAKAAAARAVVPVAEKAAEKLPAVQPDDEGSKA